MTASALKVLIVEDDEQLASVTRTLLERQSFEVAVCHDAEQGLERARAVPPDLVVLDVNLPGMDGVEACRRLRTFSDAYVVMLTGLDSETDRLVGLAVGADDYLTKPYAPRELVARIRAMQRRPRSRAESLPARRFGDLEIDPAAHRVTVAGEEIALSNTEFEILVAISARPESTISRQELLEQVWGESWFGEDHVIDVHVSNLRRKLGDPGYLVTVRGFGYRLHPV